MSYGQGWGGSPWGGGLVNQTQITPVVFDVLVEDAVDTNSEVFIGLQQIPTVIAAAQSPTKIEVVFSIAMSIDSNFISADNYTITTAEGSIQIPVLSVTPSGPLPLRRATLEIGVELDSKEYYFLTVSQTILSLTGDPANPRLAKFQWMDMTAPVFRGPLVIPIKDFSGEVRGGILGNPDGQVFFSPAYDTVGSTSTIELEQVSVCTKAFDEYHLPNPPDPTPLLTWGPGIKSVIGPGAVLWAPADRMGLPRMDLTDHPNDDFIPPFDFNIEAVLVETIDITKGGGFLNDVRWATFPAPGGKTVYKTANNLSSIGPGPTTPLKLDWPKIFLNDVSTVTDQVIINALDLVVSDSIGIVDGLTIQNITVGFIAITIDEAISISDFMVSSTQYSTVLGTDAVGLTDSNAVELLRVNLVSVSDTVATTDSTTVALFAVISVSLSDTIVITESLLVEQGVIYDVSANDTLSTTDSTSTSLVYASSASDSVTTSDSTSLSLAYSYSVSDTVSITDLADASLQGNILVDDALDISDATVIQPFYFYSVSLSDSITVTDSETLDFYVTGSDNVSLSDTTSTSSEYGRALSDTAAASDNIALNFEFDRSGADSFSVTDEITVSVLAGMIDVDAGTDTLTTTDYLSNQVDKTLGDTASVTDSIAAGREQDRSASDSVALEEVIWTGAPVQYHDTTFSPVGLWQFNESFNDSSGSAFTLTAETGTVAYGDIFPGVKGVILDGATTLVYNTSTATLGRTGDITIEMLLNLNAYTASKFLVSYSNSAAGGSTTNALYAIEMLNGSTELTFMQENGSNVASRTSTFTNRPTLNTLCHFAMTRVSNVINLYLNGVLVETSSALTTPTGGGSSVFRVGSQSGRGTAPACTIASLKVVASALTGTQIAQEYNLTLGRYYGEI